MGNVVTGSGKANGKVRYGKANGKVRYGKANGTMPVLIG